MVRPRIHVKLRPVHVDSGERLSLIRSAVHIRKSGAPEGHEALRIHTRLTSEIALWVTEPGPYDFLLSDPFHPGVWARNVEVRADGENVVTIPLRPRDDG